MFATCGVLSRLHTYFYYATQSGYMLFGYGCQLSGSHAELKRLDLLDHARFKLLSLHHCIVKTALTWHASIYNVVKLKQIYVVYDTDYLYTAWKQSTID